MKAGVNNLIVTDALFLFLLTLENHLLYNYNLSFYSQVPKDSGVYFQFPSRVLIPKNER